MSNNFKPCYVRSCDLVHLLIDEKGKGFCVGLLNRKLKSIPEGDVINLCFLVGKRKRHQYVLRPFEALELAGMLTLAYEEWKKKEKEEKVNG